MLTYRKSKDLIGVLFLTNNVINNAFSNKHLDVLKIVSSQAAISIKNASQYANLEKKVQERTKEIVKLNMQLKRMIIDRTVRLKLAQKEIVENEHKSELADITSGTLHNVKNILNSVKTSTEVVGKILDGIAIKGLYKANKMLEMHIESIVDFISSDPKGKRLMEYYLIIGQTLKTEVKETKKHIERLKEKIDIIEKIITAQQGYGGGNVVEKIKLERIVNDALIMQTETLERSEIQVECSFERVPRVIVQKTKLMHILINLIKNAQEAMINTSKEKRKLTFSITSDEMLIYLRVSDTGCGISRENLNNMFKLGFTTKADGHGFGLHSCLIYIKEMDGNMIVESEGVDKGTTFLIELPKSEKNGW